MKKESGELYDWFSKHLKNITDKCKKERCTKSVASILIILTICFIGGLFISSLLSNGVINYIYLMPPLRIILSVIYLFICLCIAFLLLFWQEKNKSIRLIIAVILLFLIPILGPIIYKLSGFYICDLYTFGITDKKDFYIFWIALFGVPGVIFTWITTQKSIELTQKGIEQNKQHMDKSIEQTQKSIELNKQHMDKSIELQSADQRETRFAKAVELLGNSNSSVRTGGAISLHALAKDFPKEYRETVFNILCSHIRTITTTEEYQNECRERAKINIKKEVEEKELLILQKTTPSNEIQTILNLIFKKDTTTKTYTYDKLKADLRGADLRGADLSDADLSDADLIYSDLSGANLSSANLSGAILIFADLLDTKWHQINITNTIFYYTKHIFTVFKNTQLSQAKINFGSFTNKQSKGIIDYNQIIWHRYCCEKNKWEKVNKDGSSLE